MSTPFIFTDDARPITGQDDLVFTIPLGIKAKKRLLDVFSAQLSFPEYFGENWNALYDCIRDLSWIEKRRVVIIHKDIPLLNVNKDAQIYLSILCKACADWRGSVEHELLVVFAPQSRTIVARLMQFNN